MGSATTADIMHEIRGLVPMYTNLALNACWPPELSPLNGAIADLSLSSDAMAADRVVLCGGGITEARLLFSSGTMLTRSKELASIGCTNLPAS